jgi:hypothetical protein
MIIFFASMAHHFPEHASQAALRPLEMHAKLAQPLSQNTPKPARNYVGADTWPINNAQVEGQVTKLKLLKRTMYGKAGFPLLRQRVLHAI